MEKTIRVATLNNFNFTQEEYNQLKQFGNNKNIFVNSNIFPISTKNNDFINAQNYKIVLTVNPYLKISRNAIGKLLLLDSKLVSFVRLKYIPNEECNLLYKKLIALNYKVVLTVMRFKRKDSFHKTIPEDKRHMYTYYKGFFRLKSKYYPNN